jgi:hypothetical protein
MDSRGALGRLLVRGAKPTQPIVLAPYDPSVSTMTLAEGWHAKATMLTPEEVVAWSFTLLRPLLPDDPDFCA